MKKRFLSLLLAGAMAMSLLAGCGGNGGQKNPDKGGSGKDEYVQLVWQWPGEARDGIKEVEDALNEMLERDLGVHVTLYPCVDWDTQLNLDVGADVQVDLALCLGTAKVAEKAEANLILPLDDLMEKYGAEIIADNGVNMGSAYYDGKIYAMPAAWTTYSAYGIYLDKKMCDKYGYTYEHQKGSGHTVDELEEIFATIKAGEGDGYYCLAPITWSNDPYFNTVFEFDALSGGSLASGVLMLNKSFENTTIENIFETDEFEEYARRMFEWQKKGYISKDASTTTSSPSDLALAGTHLGCFYWANAVDYIKDASSSYLAIDSYQLNMMKPYKRSPAAGGWVVPVTSANPQKAVETMNYIYEHDEAAWLLSLGIEGRDYEIVEEKEVNGNRQLKVKYLADDPNTLPYYMSLGVYGDRFATPVVGEGRDIMTNRDAQALDAAVPDSRVSPAAGYVFKSEVVNNEILAINVVLSEYMKTITCGLKDPDVILPEFRKALKDAGIDKVVAENQRQFDEWRQNR